MGAVSASHDNVSDDSCADKLETCDNESVVTDDELPNYEVMVCGADDDYEPCTYGSNPFNDCVPAENNLADSGDDNSDSDDGQPGIIYIDNRPVIIIDPYFNHCGVDEVHITIIDIIAEDTYDIYSYGNLNKSIVIKFKTPYENADFWVEIPGLVSKTNLTSDDNSMASITLTNITKSGDYEIICGFPQRGAENSSLPTVIFVTPYGEGITDKKTIKINVIPEPVYLIGNVVCTLPPMEAIFNPPVVYYGPCRYYEQGFKVPQVTNSKTLLKQSGGIKLTLSAVKVKKSTKKLVLKATVKDKNGAVKGKTVEFKFNAKTYHVKTGKNGIAKLTLNKNVLKKLDAGKKVKWQVTYGEKTVKKSLKVYE